MQRCEETLESTVLQHRSQPDYRPHRERIALHNSTKQTAEATSELTRMGGGGVMRRHDSVEENVGKCSRLMEGMGNGRDEH